VLLTTLQVTEFCTYGSLFDFLHSMDWMVTDERLSASVQSWTTEKDRDRDSQSGMVGSSQNNSIGSAAQSSITSGGAVSLPGTMGLTSSSAHTASPLLMHPSLSSTAQPPAPPGTAEGTVTNYPKFTKLSTPPPSPAPSPAVNNPKRVSVSPGVYQMPTRHPTATSTLKSASGDPDLEKGESEAAHRMSSSGNRGARTDSSCTDAADRLADAVNSQFLAENAVKTHSAGGSQRGSFSRSNSYRTVQHTCALGF
jgi:hypothetical protein